MSAATVPEHLRHDISGGIATITFDRPDKLNALTFAMADAFVALVEADDLDPGVRVIVVQGAGRAFTSGVDLDDHLDEQSPGDKSFAADRADIARAASRWRRLSTCHTPIVVRAHGWCAAWGLEIALHADIVLTVDDCRFFFPSVRNGAGLPDSAVVVHHVGPQWAKRLLLSGEIVDGRTAARIGLVSESLPDLAALDHAVDELTRRMAALPAALLAAGKAVVDEHVERLGRAALQSFAEEANATARRDPEVAEFGTIMQTEGRAAALAWREQRLR